MSRFTVPIMMVAVLVLAGGIIVAGIEIVSDDPVTTTDDPDDPDDPGDQQAVEDDPEIEDPDAEDPDAEDPDAEDPDAEDPDAVDEPEDSGPEDPDANGEPAEAPGDPGDDEHVVALPETGGSGHLLALAGMAAGLALMVRRRGATRWS